MGRRTTERCRIVVLTSLAWFACMTLVMTYMMDSSASTGAKPVLGRRGDSAHDGDVARRTADDGTHAQQTGGGGGGLLDTLMKGLRLTNGGPGEDGRGVHVPAEHEAEMRERFKENQFNVMVSDMISLNRSLPDYRSSACRAKTFDVGAMPKASIIIVFHNEAWSTLLRSLHSIFNRSPVELIHEIILIDDLSEREYLREPLALYLQRFPRPCKLVHLPDRQGLIKARLHGAEMATAPVLLFLDAHVEVTPGWLEPMLDRLQEKRDTVVAPIIDVISDDTFEYVTASDMTWGGFNWHLNFRWFTVSQREMERRNHDRSSPIQTPTIAGGLFAIYKDYFYEIGSYDEGMRVWGGENLEISFRVWTCGGTLEIMPCSRVGHVFRKQTPYTFPGGTANVIHGNARRTAEVWMDDYKQFFYSVVPGARNVDVGSTDERRALRSRLQCKSFKWYLENVYLESPVPATYHSIGEIRSAASGTLSSMCLDTMGRKENQSPAVSSCHGMGGNQAWSITGANEVRSDELCVAPMTGFSATGVRLAGCTTQGARDWKYDPQTHQLRTGDRCLALNGRELALSACVADDINMQWKVDGYTESLRP